MSTAEKKKDQVNLKTGMPEMTDAEKDAGYSKSVCSLFIIPCIFGGIGFGIAYAIYIKGDTAKFDEKIQQVVAFEMINAFLCAFIFARMIAHINFYPMVWKSRVMR